MRLIWTWLLVAALVAPASGLAAQTPSDPLPSLAGQFLVAEDSMGDPRFRETVIFMVRHDHRGAMGVVINRPLGELSLRELLRGLGGDGADGENEEVSGSARVHYGGPVEPALGFVLHTAERLFAGSQRVGEHIAVTDQPEILRAIGRGAPPRRHLLVLGYAGWAPGQLEAEMARDDWFTLPFDETLLFGSEHATKWRRAQTMRAIEL